MGEEKGRQDGQVPEKPPLDVNVNNNWKRGFFYKASQFFPLIATINVVLTSLSSTTCQKQSSVQLESLCTIASRSVFLFTRLQYSSDH